jgi:hypothetical protein
MSESYAFATKDTKPVEVARLNSDGSFIIFAGYESDKYIKALEQVLTYANSMRVIADKMKCCGNCTHYFPSACGDRCSKPEHAVEIIDEVTGSDTCYEWEMSNETP